MGIMPVDDQDPANDAAIKADNHIHYLTQILSLEFSLFVCTWFCLLQVRRQECCSYTQMSWLSSSSNITAVAQTRNQALTNSV